ncbi:MAG: PQQ-binding-like beta-propeller repeat protein [Sedimentisphaerales bacterium]|nr:PQQ-binding-like beta-propeller repeat protein [Sedimentisphaerales bacterium]
MLKSRVTLIIAIMFCITAEAMPAARRKAAPSIIESKWLLDESRLKSTDIEIVWQYNLPLSKNESLNRLLVREKRLFALTSRNYLASFNRMDANVMFSAVLASPGLPLAGLEYYKGELLTMVGNKLVELNTELGSVESSMAGTTGVTCPVVRNASFYYYAGLDNRLHAIRASDNVQVFEAAVETASRITSVLAGEEFVVFATGAGNVVCITADRPKKIWQFDLPKQVAGSLVYDDDSLFIACKDTKVYSLEPTYGNLLWKYQTQAILDSSPQPGNKAVYQHIPEIGLIALDKKTGSQLWRVDGGLGLLAEFGDKAFIITETGTLAAMDNAKGKELYKIDLGGPVKYATNTIDTKIYVGDSKGRLACLQPIR